MQKCEITGSVGAEIPAHLFKDGRNALRLAAVQDGAESAKIFARDMGRLVDDSCTNGTDMWTRDNTIGVSGGIKAQLNNGIGQDNAGG